MLQKLKYILLIILLPFLANAGNFHLQGDIGYRSGLSLQMGVMVSHFAKNFPLKFRIAGAYTSLDPGNPLAARRIFINNATNGTPEKSGRAVDLRFDLLYKVKWFALQNAYFFAGPRYSTFTATFDFVGGNEDFDINCDQWGFGAGLETNYAISNKINMVLSAGLDYFITDFIHGHDTTYYTNGEIYNGRENFTYNDADQAINQPKLLPKISIGFSYLLY